MLELARVRRASFYRFDDTAHQAYQYYCVINKHFSVELFCGQ